jgi:hypothetical protein
MGRRDLIRAAAVLATLVLTASAGAAGSWRQIADGRTSGPPATSTVAYVALARPDAVAFSGRLGGVSRLAHVNRATTAVVGVLADSVCSDGLVKIDDVAQKGATLHVFVVHGEAPPGTAGCQMLYGVYRFVTVSKSTLHKPYPTRAVVDGA